MEAQAQNALRTEVQKQLEKEGKSPALVDAMTSDQMGDYLTKTYSDSFWDALLELKEDPSVQARAAEKELWTKHLEVTMVVQRLTDLASLSGMTAGAKQQAVSNAGYMGATY